MIVITDTRVYIVCGIGCVIFLAQSDRRTLRYFFNFPPT